MFSILTLSRISKNIFQPLNSNSYIITKVKHIHVKSIHQLYNTGVKSSILTSIKHFTQISSPCIRSTPSRHSFQWLYWIGNCIGRRGVHTSKALCKQHGRTQNHKIKSSMYYMSAVGVFVIGMSYAAVPLYRIFCQVRVNKIFFYLGFCNSDQFNMFKTNSI